jgi:hypothetical protein
MPFEGGGGHPINTRVTNRHLDLSIVRSVSEAVSLSDHPGGRLLAFAIIRPRLLIFSNGSFMEPLSNLRNQSVADIRQALSNVMSS